MKTCNAKTRTGTPCRRRPASSRERCRLHGGASTGPTTPGGRDSQAQAVTMHGVYTAALAPEEVEAVEQGGDDTLANELLVARVQLRRALIHWATWNTEDPDALPANEYTETTSGANLATITRRRRPDMWGIVDRCLGRIGRLTEQRARIEEVRELQKQVEGLLDRTEDVTSKCGSVRQRTG